MTTKTSTTDPIFINWIIDDLPGKVGLTFAPGKHSHSKYGGGRWERDLAADLDKLVALGMGMQVCLLEDQELSSLKIPALVDEATKRGVRVVRLPIPDQGVLPNAGPVRDLVADILRAARAGTNVVIHCMGGLGRAGTIGGCALIEHGFTPDTAFARLHERRGKNCPETDAQRDFVRAYAKDRSPLALLASLLAARNRIDDEIFALIGRPALSGHIGEFIASHIFDIELERSATNAAFDGRFRSGPLAGKTVNVKLYGKHEGTLDIATTHPDYYLVLTGPKRTENSRGARPVVITDAFLFEGTPLHASLVQRGVKIGIATSVTKPSWESARIHPVCADGSAMQLSEQQRSWLNTFA